MSHARPKPWEVSSGTSSTTAGSTSGITSGSSSISGGSSAPELPSKPSTLISPTSSTSTSARSSYGSYGSGMYGGSTYGSGMYGGSSYGSGMYGSSYGSGMYGGSRFGGMAGSYGMNGMNNPMMMNGGLNNGMMGSLQQGTEATFQLIESMIGAFGGFTQMLESTYYATHNSFFTMISVAEQFQHLKTALGSLFGIYTLMDWAKKVLMKIKGAKNNLSVDEFKKFQKKLANGQESSNGVNGGTSNNNNNNNNNNNRISLKPLVLFLAAVFGLPYLMKKLVTRLAVQQQRMLEQQGSEGYIGVQTQTQQQQQQLQQQQLQSQSQLQPSIDPKKLEFARALFDFNPENEDMELKLKKGELIAILSKIDSDGEESNWWRCRSRDGRIGFVPYNYLEIIRRANGSI
ncbi:hypothetical protein CANARDRAFT_185428, partial [[Candida] arabinofermentans NRRL YB-2248]